MKNLHNVSRLTENVIAYTTHEPYEKFEHVEHTLEPIHEEIDNEASRRSKRKGLQSLLMMISMFIS
jgi:replicative DNA helicase